MGAQGSLACSWGDCAEPGQVQQGSGEGSREGSGRVWRKGHVQQGSGEGSGEGLAGFGVQSQVKFNSSGEGSGEGLGGFGAKPGQVQQGSGEGSREGLGAEPGQFPEKVWAWVALVESQVKFNRVPEKVWEALVQSRVRFNRVPEKVPEKVWEALVQSQVRFNSICGRLTHGNPAEVFPALGFVARLRKIVKIKRCGCWRYYRSLLIYLFLYLLISIYWFICSFIFKNVEKN